MRKLKIGLALGVWGSSAVMMQPSIVSFIALTAIATALSAIVFLKGN